MSTLIGKKGIYICQKTQIQCVIKYWKNPGGLNFSFYFYFWVAEDFLWFAFNPVFGLRKFRKEHIWWHAGSWWIFMPKLYWILLPAGTILYFLSLR
jgi:hypothetical protein